MSRVLIIGCGGVATALTLLILCKPMMEKLERIRIKYGMMGEEDEI